MIQLVLILYAIIQLLRLVVAQDANIVLAQGTIVGVSDTKLPYFTTRNQYFPFYS